MMETETQSLSLNSDAIAENGTFDPRYTCDLDNSSPELRWDNVPAETAGFVVMAEDIDAHGGTFTHWLIYNIPAQVHHLPAGIPPQDTLPNGIRQGINSFGKLGYSGPCPPMGDRTHRYHFRVFALRQLPTLGSRLRRDDLLRAIEPYIISTGRLQGHYQRHIQRAG